MPADDPLGHDALLLVRGGAAAAEGEEGERCGMLFLKVLVAIWVVLIFGIVVSLIRHYYDDDDHRD